MRLAVPFSCKTRICPSCIARRAEEVSADLVGRLLDVDHRHVVVSLPKTAGLRLRILEDRRLFRKLARLLHRILRKEMVRQIRVHRNRRGLLERAKPGIILAQHSWSSDLDFHPHWHLIVTDGVFTEENDFWTLFDWNVAAIQEKLRQRILAAFP